MRLDFLKLEEKINANKESYSKKTFDKISNKIKGFFSLHNHSHYSNIRLLDALARPSDMIEYSNQLGQKGLVLSDHEALSGHIKFLQAYQILKKQKKIESDFKAALGNEIYLVRENSVEELEENWANRKDNPETKFYHFLLVAKDKIGWQQLQKLSSKAWENSFTAQGMRRCPTLKSDMKETLIGKHVIASSACLGSELSNYILWWKKAEEIPNNEKQIKYYKYQIQTFIQYCIDVFGKENFFLEIQPSYNVEQAVVNQTMFYLAKAFDLKVIVTTDSHYIKKEDRLTHKIYLQSKEGEREVDEFYSSTYHMDAKNIYDYLSTHLEDAQIIEAINNTLLIYDMIEEYDLYHPIEIPNPHIPKFVEEHYFERYYDQYSYIKRFAFSEYEVDRYYLNQVEKGFKEHIETRPNYNEEYMHKALDRINTEMGELWKISDKLKQRMGQYYILTQEIVDIIWEAGSLTPAGRGSSSGYLTNYLLNITQYNPMDYGLPYFRHLNSERVSLPDVDIDSSAAKRPYILELIKQKFGEDKVLNIATFGTEGAKSAIQAACRGLNIPVEDARQMSGLIPVERGQQWPLTDCFKGNKEKGRKAVTELINLTSKYENLAKVAMDIEGTINKSSIHASGLYIFNQPYYISNALMKAPNGQSTTQFDQDDSDFLGGLKEDLLTVEAVDIIQECLEQLIKDGFIEWQGSLRDTYNKYLHPNVLDFEDKEIWETINRGNVIALFQFDTQQGSQAIKKIKPQSLEQLATSNSVMRLMSDTETSPIEKYAAFKADPTLWEEEMNKYHLTDEEKDVARKYFGVTSGISAEQEQMMLLVQDEKVGNFSISQADTLRKAVAKKKLELLEESKKLLYSKISN